MKKQSMWRFVVWGVGVALALAGIICILIAHWDKVTACMHSFFTKCADIFSCPEFDDYGDFEDDLLYE